MALKSTSLLGIMALSATMTLFALPLEVGQVRAAINNGGGAGIDSNCEVVSVGNYYCTIDGKGYYCTTGTSPDKNKDCVAAAKTTKPRFPIGAVNPGGIKLNKTH